MNLEDKLNYFVIEKKENEMMDFQKIFQNNHPVHLEIGSGKGELIQMQSFFHHFINFIGIEIKSKRIITTVKKLDIQKNKNVRLLNLFVDEKINQWISAGSVDEIIIFHPDPWPKRKHFDRRLIQHRFIDCLSWLLKENGILKISTDHPGYAEWIIRHFKERQDYVALFDDVSRFIFPEDHFTTYFDDLKAREGYLPQFLYYKKKVV
ncbi:MAG TPA: tRNA (guanosine(46)-N7)-methyltransferase TrmB [Candidatus Cloacimonadota bacterium]|jgi:tRNA (guanine-N7-)-methyltransferase|nr:tRNA (guanosine(46)-N7)-methyltransferase TrmB [Candidatus Cloacimonadota bacterium]HOD53044.1 tRNA (guanosine(46)-N7)-methyltransferase TrmB [Candidatus Cloacimonadota bacterium]HPM01979.1 tRNA (guanosine(46)-N7)-methyltransferase TrmB [Candidatus Cloacimonadota bacterium]